MWSWCQGIRGSRDVSDSADTQLLNQHHQVLSLLVHTYAPRYVPFHLGIEHHHVFSLLVHARAFCGVCDFIHNANFMYCSFHAWCSETCEGIGGGSNVMLLTPAIIEKETCFSITGVQASCASVGSQGHWPKGNEGTGNHGPQSESLSALLGCCTGRQLQESSCESVLTSFM